MLARVATFDQAPAGSADAPAAVRLREIVRSQPGFRAGYHMLDPKTGKALSIVVVDGPATFAAMGQALAARPPEDRVGVDPDHVAIYEVAAEF